MTDACICILSRTLADWSIGWATRFATFSNRSLILARILAHQPVPGVLTMSRRLYPTEPGSVAIAYSDIPSLHLRGRLARKSQDRARKPNHDLRRAYSSTREPISPGSIVLREGRQRLKRSSTSINGLGRSHNASVGNLSDTSTNQIFVHQVTTVVGTIEGAGDTPPVQTFCRGGNDENHPQQNIPTKSFLSPELWHTSRGTSSGSSELWHIGEHVSRSEVASDDHSSELMRPPPDSNTTTSNNSPRPSSDILPHDQDHPFPRPTDKPKPGKRRFRLRIPDFLLPLDAPAVPVRIYDVPLRRELFQKAQPGNEVTLTAAVNTQMERDQGALSSAVSDQP